MLPALPPAPPPVLLDAEGDLQATFLMPQRLLEGEALLRVRQRSGAPLRELVLSLPANQGDPSQERLAFSHPDWPWGTRLESLSLDGQELPLPEGFDGWALRLPLAEPFASGAVHVLKLRFWTQVAPGPRPTGLWADGGVGLLGAHPQLLAPLPDGSWPASPGGAWAPAAPGLPMRWRGRLHLPPGWQAAGPGRLGEDGAWVAEALPGLGWVAGPLWQVGEAPAQGAGPAVRWAAPPALAEATASLAAQAAAAGPSLARRLGPAADGHVLLASGSASPWGLAVGPGWAVAPEGALALAAQGGPDAGLRWLATRGLAGAWWPSTILDGHGEVVGWGPALGAWAAAEAWDEGEGEAWGWAQAERQLPQLAVEGYRALRLKPADAQRSQAWRWVALGLEGGLDRSLQRVGPGAAVALVEAWGPARLADWAQGPGGQGPRASVASLGDRLRLGPLGLAEARALCQAAGADAMAPWQPKASGVKQGLGPWAGSPWPPALGMSPGALVSGLGRDMNRGAGFGFRDGRPIGVLSGGFPIPGILNEAGRLQGGLALRPEGVAWGGNLVGAWRPKWGSAYAWRPYLGLASRPILPGESVYAASMGLQLDEGGDLVDLRPARRMVRVELEAGQGRQGLAPGAWLESSRTWPWGASGAWAMRGLVAGRWDTRVGDAFRLDREAGFRRADVGGASAMVALQAECLAPLGDSIGLPRGLGWVVPMGLVQTGLGWAGSPHLEAGLGLRLSLLGWGNPLSVQLEWTPVGPGGFSFGAWNTRFGHAW